MARRIARWFVAVAVLTILAAPGCQTRRTWNYKADVQRGGHYILDRSVVVLRFQDSRPNKNEDRLQLYNIPLLPYGWANYETPEGALNHVSSGRGAWTFRPVDDITRAVADEVRGGGIFREVFEGNRTSEGDLALRGEIISTRYGGKFYSYGLGPYGPLLWLAGIPAGGVENDLEVRLILESPDTREVLWTHTVRRSRSVRMNLYSQKPDLYYDELLKEGMKGAIASLGQWASEKARQPNPPSTVRRQVP